MCRYGGDCYLFAAAALGFVHLATDASLNAYDIQALIPIIRGAGGVVTTYDGGNPAMGGTVLASSNSTLHERALAILNE
jgi:myo-inositol-1(or 4)-monophosphatase